MAEIEFGSVRIFFWKARPPSRQENYFLSRSQIGVTANGNCVGTMSAIGPDVYKGITCNHLFDFSDIVLDICSTMLLQFM